MTDDAASVVCSQLGLGSSGSTIKHAPFGEGNGTIWLSRVRCTGKEYRLEYCPHAPWGNAAGCTHSEDVGISCLGTVGSGDTAPGVGEPPADPPPVAAPAGSARWHERSVDMHRQLRHRDMPSSLVAPGQLTCPCATPSVAVTVRLVGGSTKRQGRLEVLQKGLWLEWGDSLRKDCKANRTIASGWPSTALRSWQQSAPSAESIPLDAGFAF